MVIILATSVCAFAVNVQIYDVSDVPTMYPALGTSSSSLNVLSESEFNSKYSSLSSFGWPVTKVSHTVGGVKYNLIQLYSDVAITYVSGGYFGNYSAPQYVGDINGPFAVKVSTSYSVSAIAGTSSYYLTNRPVGTTGNGYAGDMAITSANWTNIKNLLDNLSSSRFYYAMAHSVNGETRYYLTPSGYSSTYYVCNSAGQLYYYVKEEASGGGSGDGTTFDSTEVITAINSVYEAIEWGFWDVCRWLDAIQDNISSFNDDVLMLSQNVVSGFTNLTAVGNDIDYSLSNLTYTVQTTERNIVNSLEEYFGSLGKSYPVLTTVKLSGNDNLFEWNEGDIIQSVEFSGVSDGDVVVRKSFIGDKFTLENIQDGYEWYEYQGNVGIRSMPYPNGDVVINENLLSNSIFYSPQNSNGQSVYAATSTFTTFIDNWIFLRMGYRVSDYSFTADCLDTGSTLGVARTVIGKCADMVGSTYTISLFTSETTGNYSLQLATGNSSGSYASQVIKTVTYNTKGFHFFTFTVPSDLDLTTYPYLVLSLSLRDGDSVRIQRIKLEEGTQQSLCYQNYSGLYSFYESTFTPKRAPIIDYGAYTRSLSFVLKSRGTLHDFVFYDTSFDKWRIYRAITNSYEDVSVSDEVILDSFLGVGDITNIPLGEFNIADFRSSLSNGINYIDVAEDSFVIIEYYHTGTWFEYVYHMMDKLYERIGEADGSVVNIENTVVDILQDNDAFNIFYIEKTDGTTESVGDAATDAAKVVGEFLSVFYRLIFADGLENAEIIGEFEEVYTVRDTGVNVW